MSASPHSTSVGSRNLLQPAAGLQRSAASALADFRAAAGQQPLNLLLGELVQRHVDRYRARRLQDGELDDTELLDALDRARELHSDLAALVTRLEQRLARASGANQEPATGAQAHLDLDDSGAR